MTGGTCLSGRRVDFVVRLASQFEAGVAHRGDTLEGKVDGGTGADGRGVGICCSLVADGGFRVVEGVVRCVKKERATDVLICFGKWALWVDV